MPNGYCGKAGRKARMTVRRVIGEFHDHGVEQYVGGLERGVAVTHIMNCASCQAAIDKMIRENPDTIYDKRGWRATLEVVNKVPLVERKPKRVAFSW